MAGTNKIRVTQTRSVHGRLQSHKDTVRGLGLRRIRHTVELADTPEIRGMINKIAYMVKVED
jgi:large subunit ribosomal protein L30